MVTTMPAPTMSTTTSLVEVPDLGTWADDWDALVLRSPLPTPFLRSWWLQGAAALPGERGGRPHYLLVLDGEDLIGGLALERRRVLGSWHYRMLTGGTLCPDHLDLVVAPGRESEVIGELRGWFTGPGSRVLDLDGLCEDALVLEVLGPVCQGTARVSLTDVAVHEPLPATFPEYQARRSTSFNKQLRKFRRKSDAAGVTYRRAEDSEIPAAMVEFERMHSVRHDRRALVRELPRLLRAVEAGTDRGEVRVYLAETDDRCGVVVLLFITGGRISMYQTARRLEPDFNHAGTLLDAVLIADACAEGLADLDFLRGAEPYKLSFATSQRNLWRARAASGPIGRMLLAAEVLGTSARRRIGAAVRRISPRLTIG